MMPRLYLGAARTARRAIAVPRRRDLGPGTWALGLSSQELLRLLRSPSPKTRVLRPSRTQHPLQ